MYNYAQSGINRLKNSIWLHKKMLLIFVLGFMSGLPLGLVGTTLQAWYTEAGVDLITIGCLTLIGQPYVYKFLWAPAMDKYAFPFIGRRKGWMIGTQVALIFILICMALTPPKTHPLGLGILALCLAFFSASQDIVLDAYRTEILSAEERGAGSVMATTGYRLAMIVSAGLSLILANCIGFALTYLFMALLVILGLFIVSFAKEPTPSFSSSFTSWHLPFKEFMGRPKALILLAFLVCYKLGDAYCASLSTTFLLKGVGFSLVEIGQINKIGGLVFTILGAFVGAAFLKKIGLYRALLYYGFIQALSNLLFSLLAYVGPHYGLFVFTICAENFSAGLGSAALMVFSMGLCNPRYTASQFALITALAAAGRVFVGPTAGLLVNQVGWVEFYLWTTFFAIPGLLLLYLLRPSIETPQEIILPSPSL